MYIDICVTWIPREILLLTDVVESAKNDQSFKMFLAKHITTDFVLLD